MLTFKDDKCFRGKNSKNELLFCSVPICIWGKKHENSGHSIGKNKLQRCFKGVKSLKVDYDYNKKLWMASEIFEK